jgi:phenylpropionate dioxygenase-like ring-hydroxylating dioxygenase large terminal subunit
MDPKQQVELIRRGLAHVASRTTDRDAEPTTVPVEHYIDERRYAREIDVLFRQGPITVGHSSQLVAPGDFLTHDGSGVPLLVVRGNDGTLRAFLNVCRHRGTRVENERCGRSKGAFACPYHGWTYGRDGRVQMIPHDNGFPGIDRESRGLVRVPVGEAAGLVWVRATPATSPEDFHLDATGYVGELADQIAGFGINTAHVYSPVSSEREMNWKLAIDIFLETYHLRPTHKNTIYPLFFDNLGLVDRFGPHLRTVLPKRTIKTLATEPDEALGSALRHHSNVVFHLFPNTIVLIMQDHATIVSMWPISISRTRFMKYTLIPEPAETEKARAHWDLNNTIVQFATEEDIVLGESIQKGLLTGANKEVVFGAFEHALAHFHSGIAKRLDAAPETTSPRRLGVV